MFLEDKDILQIDATVITGVLILLTLSFTSLDETVFTSENQTQHVTALDNELRMNRAEILNLGFTVSIIVPFAWSAVLVINDVLSQKPTRNFRASLRLMRLGFLYIIFGIGAIAFIQVLLLTVSF